MRFQFPQPKPSEITNEHLFKTRRSLIKSLGVGAAALTFPNLLQAVDKCPSSGIQIPDPGLPITPKRAATGYNNYYEFSTDKEAVRILAQALTLSPWQISITGQVEQPLQLDVDEIRKQCEEERLYRFRCVEGWSMVVPWLGVSLSDILKKAKPLSSAKFVRFSSIVNLEEMIGQRRPTLEWPYTEGLRIDEAMHPLTILATGMYGQSLPPQNGAPLRLIVPWKYGFKSIKAIQKIELLEQQPVSSWQAILPNEYGFYANVNPKVAHPRWSQSREVPLGQTKKRPTLMFNGYEEQVASLYSGMDLSKHF